MVQCDLSRLVSGYYCLRVVELCFIAYSGEPSLILFIWHARRFNDIGRAAFRGKTIRPVLCGGCRGCCGCIFSELEASCKSSANTYFLSPQYKMSHHAQQPWYLSHQI